MSNSHVMDYMNNKFEEAQAQKDQLTSAINTRKRTVMDFYLQINGVKATIAAFNRQKKSTARIRALRSTLYEDCLQHEQVLAHLKVMRQEKHREVHLLRQALKMMEANNSES